LARLLLIVLPGLLLANALSLTLVMIERMHSARTVMLGNLEYDVATSVAILDRLPATNARPGCRALNGVTIVISSVRGAGQRTDG
jgi:hypothetical protein